MLIHKLSHRVNECQHFTTTESESIPIPHINQNYILHLN